MKTNYKNAREVAAAIMATKNFATEKEEFDSRDYYIVTAEEYEEIKAEFLANCAKAFGETVAFHSKIRNATCEGLVRATIGTYSHDYIVFHIVEAHEEAKVEDEIELDVSMITNYVRVKNDGHFDITIDGKTYRVVYDAFNGTIETDAPHKEQIRKWFFEV